MGVVFVLACGGFLMLGGVYFLRGGSSLMERRKPHPRRRRWSAIALFPFGGALITGAAAYASGVATLPLVTMTTVLVITTVVLYAVSFRYPPYA